MLTARLRRYKGETIDIIGYYKKRSMPGSSIPEVTLQSQLKCLLVYKSKREDKELAPVTTKTQTYTCFLFQGFAPNVAQVIRRSNGDRLTILTEPRKFSGVIYFSCQHIS